MVIAAMIRFQANPIASIKKETAWCRRARQTSQCPGMGCLGGNIY